MKTMTNARYSCSVNLCNGLAVADGLCFSALMAADCNSIPKPSGVLLVQCDAVSPTENE